MAISFRSIGMQWINGLLGEYVFSKKQNLENNRTIL
jgi:hypothetical protein